MKRELLIAELLSTPWALEPGYLAAFSGVMHRWNRGEEASHEVMAGIAADRSNLAARKPGNLMPRTGNDSNIAVLPLYGVMTQRGNMVNEVSGSGSMSTQQFTMALRQALQDPSIGAILIDIDSPGGSVYGIDELAQEVMSARAQKSIIGLVNSLAASAAYWVGAACSELYVTPGGEVGSIGVFSAHDDRSKAMEADGITRTYISAGKYKTEGNPAGPLSAEAQAHMQSRVDDYYGAFTQAVAKGRGVSVATVRSDYGQGRVYGASQALSAHMVDGIATFDDVVRKMAGKLKAPARSLARNQSIGRSAGDAFRPHLAHVHRELSILEASGAVEARPANRAAQARRQLAMLE